MNFFRIFLLNNIWNYKPFKKYGTFLSTVTVNRVNVPHTAKVIFIFMFPVIIIAIVDMFFFTAKLLELCPLYGEGV